MAPKPPDTPATPLAKLIEAALDVLHHDRTEGSEVDRYERQQLTARFSTILARTPAEARAVMEMAAQIAERHVPSSPSAECEREMRRVCQDIAAAIRAFANYPYATVPRPPAVGAVLDMLLDHTRIGVKDAAMVRALIKDLQRQVAGFEKRFDRIVQACARLDWSHCTTEKELIEQIDFTISRAEQAEAERDAAVARAEKIIWDFAFKPVILDGRSGALGTQCLHCKAIGEYLPGALVHDPGCKVALALARAALPQREADTRSIQSDGSRRVRDDDDA